MSMSNVAALWCSTCETPTVLPTTLGFIAPDGVLGELAGFACAECREAWEAPEAVPVVIGRLDLDGQDPLTWFLGRLHAPGCDPRPRP